METKAEKERMSRINSRCMLKGLEIGILTIALCVVWGLYALPTVFYALPPLTQPQRGSTVTGDSNDPSIFTCSPRVSYEGEACQSELRGWQECFSGPQVDETIYIPSNIDQEAMEDRASMFLTTGLLLLRPGPECDTIIRPFLCLFLFGSCDTNNQSHHTSVEDCVRIRDEVCPSEWTQAVGLLGEGVLPNCEELPTTETEDQPINDCFNANGTETVQNMSSLTPNDLELKCSDGFYLNGSVCRPECGSWTNPSYLDNPTLETSIVIVSTVIALVCALLFNLIVVTLQRDITWTFPSAYLVYITVTVSVLGLVILIGTTSQTTLFCSSRDLLESVANATPFCTFTGVVYYYGLLQIAMWLLFHSGALFWGIVFPFHYRRWKVEGKHKHVHITTVILALLLPTIPAFVNLRYGYSGFSSPTIVCQGRNANSTYATLILPFSIIWAVSSSMLLVIFWTIFKQLVIKRHGASRETSGDKKRLVGKAEIKIMFVLCYYTLLGVLFLIYFTTYQVTREVQTQALRDYFFCESAQNKDCESISTTPEVRFSTGFSLVVYVLEGMVPLVVLIFGVDVKTLRKCMRCNRTSSGKLHLSKRTSATNLYAIKTSQ